MPKGMGNQPVNGIEWIDVDKLRGNNYNPNHVAPPELELLKISILKSGWTQPIVCRTDYQIVDGYHRFLLAKGNKEIRQMTDGKVPVCFLSQEVSEEEQMMATIRHNRARGSHHVLKMADIVRILVDDYAIPMGNVEALLGMETEEAERLYDNSGMIQRGSKDEFSKGWGPA